MIKRNKIFKYDIMIKRKQFIFKKDKLTYVVCITSKGYQLITFEGNVRMFTSSKISLEKLNLLLPDDMQLTKDHIIYVLTQEENYEILDT